MSELTFKLSNERLTEILKDAIKSEIICEEDCTGSMCSCRNCIISKLKISEEEYKIIMGESVPVLEMITKGMVETDSIKLSEFVNKHSLEAVRKLSEKYSDYTFCFMVNTDFDSDMLELGTILTDDFSVMEIGAMDSEYSDIIEELINNDDEFDDRLFRVMDIIHFWRFDMNWFYNKHEFMLAKDGEFSYYVRQGL